MYYLVNFNLARLYFNMGKFNNQSINQSINRSIKLLYGAPKCWPESWPS